MATTKIEWTATVLSDGRVVPGYTFNPWRGCTKVARECQSCYADKLAKRNPSTLGQWGPHGTRVVAAERYWKWPEKWDAQAAADGVRKRVFCASLADVFEQWDGPMLRGEDTDGVPFQLHHFEGRWSTARLTANYIADGPVTMDDVRRRLFSLIDATPNLDWLLLTKRPQNILRMWPTEPFGPDRELEEAHRPNVWLGTSAGTQETADTAIPELLKCRDLSPGLVVSCEPMLGAVDFSRWLSDAVCCDVCGPSPQIVTLPIDKETVQDFCMECNESDPEAVSSICGDDPQLNWIIIGVESNGPRVGDLGDFNSEADWIEGAADIVRQCRDAGVPCFVKQVPINGKVSHDPAEWPDSLRVREFPEIHT